MIPIQLKIKGLYSFKEEQVIDFKALLDSHIFGIFGKVGSGKSTILEAITFSLYGESERLNSRDNRGYNMMNLQSNELKIEFIFTAGNPKTKYRSLVTGKRNQKRFDDVKTYSRTLYKEVNGTWIPIDKSQIASIIGLSYVNFKRTIIIPQGKFQEFLALGHKDRSDMLKEIFNLQKFDLSAKINILSSQNKDKIARLSGQLLQLDDVSTVILKNHKTELKQLEKNHTALEIIQEKEEKLLQKQLELKKLFAQKHQAQDEYDNYIEKYQDRYKEMEIEAQKTAYCIEHFKNKLEQKAIQDKDIAFLEKAIQTDTNTLEKIKTQLKTIQSKFSKIKIEVEKKEYYHKIILDIEKSIAIAEYRKEQKEQEALLQKGILSIKQLEKAITEKKQNEKSLQTNLKSLQKKLPDFIELNKIRDWFEIEKDFQQRISELNKESQTIQNQLDIIRQQASIALQPLLTEIKNIDQLPLKKSIDSVKEVVKQTHQQIQAIHLEEKHLFAQNELIGHAQNLENGMPCPICGSVEHPNKLETKNLNAKITALETKRLKLEHLLETSNQIINQLTDFFSSERDFKERQVIIEKKLSELNKKLEKHKKTRFWTQTKIDSLATIQKIVGEAQSLQTQINQIEKTIQQNFSEVEKLESKLASIQPQIEDYQKLTHQLDSKIDVLESQINPSNLEKLKTYSIEKLENLKQKYEDTIISNEEEYAFLDSQLKTLSDQQTSLVATLKLNTSNLKKEGKILQKLNDKLEHQLRESPFQKLDEIEQILALNKDPKLELERVEKYKKEVFAKEEKLKDLLTKTKGLHFDEAQYKQLQTHFETRKQEIKNLYGQIAKSRSKIQELTVKVKEKNALEKELKALESRAENIQTLAKLFKGQGFVNYISSVYLQNIIKAANDRFAYLTKHELSLELAEDNSFNIRDMLNGGKIRNIKTLSGGQTFQAALSLALALADNIHELTKSKQNFFFLDEGFGTQDNDSITAVFQTLKALRKENRTVGIISHVDSLQQEIDVHLMVKKDDEGGSRVIGSWG